MFCSVSISGCLNRTPWTFRRSDHVVVYSKKNPHNGGYPGRGRSPRKKYSKNVEDEVDISPLYEDSDVTEIPRGFVVDCAKHINNCIKRRNMQEAQEVFDLMIKKDLYPDVVTYTTMMKGYSKAGENQMVYGLFRDMEKNGLRPNEITFSTIIRACANSGDLQRALILLDKMTNRYWLTPDDYIYNALLNVCARAKDLKKAKDILEEMASSETIYDVITLATMIDVYAECCNKDNARQYLKECRDLMEEMDSEGVKANLQTFNILLKLCARGCLTTEAMELLNEMTIKNVHPNCVSYSTVMDGISKDETLSDREVVLLSKEVVHRMKQESVPLSARIYTCLISVALRIRDLDKAVGLFDKMKRLGIKPTVVTYGIMIKCYEKLGDPSAGDAYLKPCIDLLTESERSGIVMDKEGYTSLLSACANVANLDAALEIWSKIKKAKTDVFTYTAMVGVYLNADEENKAFDLLDEMKTSGVEPNQVTYNTFIAHFMKKKDRSGAQRAYIEMNSLVVKPDKDTLNMLKALRVG